MKTFVFEFDINGRATATVKAETFEEACKLFDDGSFDSKVQEWDFDFPYGMRFDEEHLKDHLVPEDKNDDNT